MNLTINIINFNCFECNYVRNFLHVFYKWVFTRSKYFNSLNMRLNSVLSTFLSWRLLMSRSSHVSNGWYFEHLFIVGLDLIHFMSVDTINLMSGSTIIPLIGILEGRMGESGWVAGVRYVVVAREYLCEGVSKLYLSIKSLLKGYGTIEGH